MSEITEDLAETLRALSPEKAASVEKVVREVIELAAGGETGASPSGGLARHEGALANHRAHWKKMDELIGELDWSGLERAPQGEVEVRER